MAPVAESSSVVAVLADDLIWSTRLAGQVRAAGARAVPVRDLPALVAILADSDAVIIDLTALAYDGVAAVEAAASARCRVLAVGQHDDAALRRAALTAGAERVFAYRKLFEDGPETLRRWLAAGVGVARPAREGVGR